jgi:hypothetical protein
LKMNAPFARKVVCLIIWQQLSTKSIIRSRLWFSLLLLTWYSLILLCCRWWCEPRRDWKHNLSLPSSNQQSTRTFTHTTMIWYSTRQYQPEEVVVTPHRKRFSVGWRRGGGWTWIERDDNDNAFFNSTTLKRAPWVLADTTNKPIKWAG